MNNTLIKKVLVAVNETEEALRTAMDAIMFAKVYSAELMALFVVDTATIQYLRLNDVIAGKEGSVFENELTKEGNNYLEYIQELAAKKGVKIEKEIRFGTVYSEIINAAKDFEADLIMIGGTKLSPKLSYQRKNVSSAVQAELITSSPYPIMIVNKENIEAEFQLFE